MLTILSTQMDVHQGGWPALSQRTHGQLGTFSPFEYKFWRHIFQLTPSEKKKQAGQIGVFFLAIFGILYCLRENKLRAAGKRDHRLEGLTEDETLHLGYRHPSFRYIT